MLVAKRKDGALFSLLERDKSELLALRRQETFYCPVCQTAVQLRLGDKRSWHFAHRSKTRCPFEAEAESAYHLEGKRLLCRWLADRGATARLEPYLPQLKQRPDLLLHTHPHITALEFQCASIAPDLLIKRTKTFQHAGVLPVWLLGGNRLKRIGAETFQLSQMDWLGLRQEPKSDSPFLLYFCPETRQFAELTHLMPYSASKTFARLTYHPISSFTVQDLYRASHSHPFEIPEQWIKMKQQWRINAFRYKSRTHRYVQKLFGQLSLIPPAAGWPTPHSYSIETPCFLWQSWLFYQFYLCWPADQLLTLQNVKNTFDTFVNRQIFSVRRFPMVNVGAGEALLDYLRCLVAFGFYEQTAETSFQKQNELALPQSVEDYQHLDRVYFEKFSGIF